MYYQPEIFGGLDYSFPLPCNLHTIDTLIQQHSTDINEHGCSAQFLQIVELISGRRQNEFPVVQTSADAELLFRTISAALPTWINSLIKQIKCNFVLYLYVQIAIIYPKYGDRACFVDAI